MLKPDPTGGDCNSHAKHVFNLEIPKTCPGVPPKLLDPRAQWADKDAYDHAALDLRDRFRKNYEKFGGPEIAKVAGG